MIPTSRPLYNPQDVIDRLAFHRKQAAKKAEEPSAAIAHTIGPEMRDPHHFLESRALREQMAAELTQLPVHVPLPQSLKKVDDPLAIELLQELDAIRTVLGSWKYSDSHTRKIRGWEQNFREALGVADAKETCKSYVLLMTNHLSTDDLFRTPFDEESYYDENGSFSNIAWEIYKRPRPSLYHERSPFHPERGAPFLNIKHRPVCHMVKWLKSRGVAFDFTPLLQRQEVLEHMPSREEVQAALESHRQRQAQRDKRIAHATVSQASKLGEQLAALRREKAKIQGDANERLVGLQNAAEKNIEEVKQLFVENAEARRRTATLLEEKLATHPEKMEKLDALDRLHKESEAREKELLEAIEVRINQHAEEIPKAFEQSHARFEEQVQDVISAVDAKTAACHKKVQITLSNRGAQIAGLKQLLEAEQEALDKESKRLSLQNEELSKKLDRIDQGLDASSRELTVIQQKITKLEAAQIEERKKKGKGLLSALCLVGSIAISYGLWQAGLPVSVSLMPNLFGACGAVAFD